MVANVCPFRYRQWMMDNSGAAAAASGHKGLKGVMAGGITGGIEICITYPTEYVKTHLQLDEKGDRKQYDGIIDCVKKTVNKHGVRGLYRGLSVLVYGSIPKSAVRFGTFEQVKSLLQSPTGELAPAYRAFCGMCAGIGEAIFAVTPMETIKVKFIHDQRLAEPKYRGFVHGILTILRTDGVSGVYKGVTATILKQGTNQMMRFGVMESLKAWYRGPDPTKHIPKPVIGVFGFTAGFVSVMGNTPLDVVKTRMQGLEASKYKNTLDCMLNVYVNEGIYAFYKGTVPRLGRVCLDVAITFMLYETITDMFNKIWP